jgi:malonate transporter and related proteins
LSQIIDVVLPIFAIILAGYLAGRRGLLGTDSSGGLNAYVYYVALPAMLFLALASIEPADLLDFGFLAAFFIPAFIVALASGAAAGFFRKGRGAVWSLAGLTGAFSNTGYMGIPLFVSAFGAAGAAPAAIVTMVYGLVGVTLAVVMIEADVKSDIPTAARFRAIAMAILVNPMIMAPILGLVVAMIGVPIISPVYRFLDLVGQSAGPCALFALGLFLVKTRIGEGMAEVGTLTVMKLFIQPLLTWAAAVWVFDLTPERMAAAVLLAALPTAATSFVLAERYGIYGQQASGTILVTTLFSVVTLAALVAILPM